jgi:AraC-like DNA-binding protein
LWGPVTGLLFYGFHQAYHRLNDIPFDETYGLSWTPINLFRWSLAISYGTWVVWRFYRYLIVYQKFSELRYSAPLTLRLTILRGLGLSLIVSVLIMLFDFITGPGLQLWKLRPWVAVGSLAALSYHTMKYSIWFEKEPGEPKPSKVTPDEMLKVRDRLIQSFEKDHLYLNADLRLADVAQAIDEKSYKISSTLSEYFNKNFFEFVNAYRVEQAKKNANRPGFSAPQLVGHRPRVRI